MLHLITMMTCRRGGPSLHLLYDMGPWKTMTTLANVDVLSSTIVAILAAFIHLLQSRS
eukprot:c29948_g1_i1 orf=186-359(+)